MSGQLRDFAAEAIAHGELVPAGGASSRGGFVLATGRFTWSWDHCGELEAPRWAVETVRSARTDRQAARGSALDVFARSGLDDRTAATELLNVLRPTVAVAWFGTFAALALDRNPEWRARLSEDAASRAAFAHEVRRLYPFVPALAAKTRRTLEWQGHRLPAGRRVVLDVRGTDLDPAVFDDPTSFRPDRFAQRLPGPYELLPQGGGHPETGHRCPGERITLRLLDVTLQVLASTPYAVVGDPHYSLRRMPTAPKDGLLVSVVEPSAAAPAPSAAER